MDLLLQPQECDYKTSILFFFLLLFNFLCVYAVLLTQPVQVFSKPVSQAW